VKFTKLTEAEQAEFLELTKDCIDPEVLTEDDLPWLRALRKKWEEQRPEEPAQAHGASSEEEPDTCDGWNELSHWDYL
jgi:hypothetical protein